MSNLRPARPPQRRTAERASARTHRGGGTNPFATAAPALAGSGLADAGAMAGAAGDNGRGEHPRASDGLPSGALRPPSPSQELLCSGIGLTLKLSLALVAGVSLVRLAGAYQERLDRYGEITAVLDIQKAKLLKAQSRFDNLFATGGEQRLIQEQDQWIAPNRLRVVWKQPSQPSQPFPTVERR